MSLGPLKSVTSWITRVQAKDRKSLSWGPRNKGLAKVRGEGRDPTSHCHVRQTVGAGMRTSQTWTDSLPKAAAARETKSLHLNKEITHFLKSTKTSMRSHFISSRVKLLIPAEIQL